MANDSLICLSGKVIETITNQMFKVHLENNVDVIATVSGKLKFNKIRIVKGDEVQVELSLYDLTRGRIVFRK
ncbi:MAG: translation initiation factor IF-1 [Mycoplasmataceae bacterium]|jgi:translation initiation factor IF-1|nr:translation initiation factor IF-1 [Mycoplasmataceae bacterium]